MEEEIMFSAICIEEPKECSKFGGKTYCPKFTVNDRVDVIEKYTAEENGEEFYEIESVYGDKTVSLIWPAKYFRIDE